MLIKNEKRLLFASTIISLFELFDFVSFIFLSPVLTILFLPPQFKTNSFIFTILSITLSYICRPIGGILLANFGDKYGRKSVFAISVLMMAIPSFSMAITPTYNKIGIVSTFLLLFCRIMNAFSLGGEVPGSITYLSEVFKGKNIFFYCSWLTFGANLGLVFSAQLIKFLTSNFSHSFMYNFGWRIPFLTGGILTIIVAYVRKKINESPEFKKIKHQKKINKVPFVDLIMNYKIQILYGVLLSFIVSITTAIFHLLLPNILANQGKINIVDATNMSSIGAICLAVGSIIFGYLVKYIRVNSIIKFSIFSIIILVSGYYFIFLKEITQFNFITFIIAISLLLSGVNGVFFGVLSKLFPTNVRFSGISICFNCAYILGVGITPLWINYIVKINANNFLFDILIIYITLIILSYCSFQYIRKKKFVFD